MISSFSSASEEPSNFDQKKKEYLYNSDNKSSLSVCMDIKSNKKVGVINVSSWKSVVLLVVRSNIIESSHRHQKWGLFVVNLSMPNKGTF